MASVSDFQSEHEGSIPFTCSKGAVENEILRQILNAGILDLLIVRGSL